MYQDNPREVAFTGTVSSGTMREEDLLPKFAYVLEKYGMKRSALTARAAARLIEMSDTDKNRELVSIVLNEEVWEAMNEIAPEGYYFGAHEGDGSDYGYWLAEEF
jgi:hypothetical protein